MATAQSKQIRTGKEGAAFSQLLLEIRLALLREKGKTHFTFLCIRSASNIRSSQP
jgi:hypothetical protein